MNGWPRDVRSILPSRTPVPLRHHLILLVAGVLLPVVAFSVALVWRLTTAERNAAERRLAQASHDLAHAVDRELDSTIRALQALAESERLEDGDLGAFYAEASRVVRVQPSWQLVTLATPDGTQVLNTGRALGTTRPVTEPASLSRAVRTGHPTVGLLVPGKVDGTLAFPVRVPVVKGGEFRYALTAVITPGRLAELLHDEGRERPDREWARVLVDAGGTVVARTRDPDRFVGRPATPTFQRRTRGAVDGFYQDVTLEGREAYVAFTRGALSDWTTAVVIPVEVLDGPVRRSLLAVAGAGGALLVVSMAGAFVLSQRVERGMAAVTAAAERLATGGQPPALRSPVAEVDRLGDALRRSGELLADRERQRNELLDRAEAANRAKDEFLAMLGHELRNPLGPVRNGVHLVGTLPPDDPQLPQVRQMIERQVGHMTRMVDDLLDASRVARGKLSLHREPVDLAQAVREAAADCRPDFDRAGLTLTLDAPDAPLRVDGDRTRLAQCLANLLHNARKFTPAGGAVTLSVALDDGGRQAVVTVRDSGAGIDRDLIPRLFRPFAQGPQALGRTQGGLGLGLALVHGIVDLHGGTVSAHSDGPGTGSTFTIRLPAVADQAPAAPGDPALPTPAVPGAAAPRRVLIVEDLADAARTLRLLLAHDGHDVRVAATAAEALSIAPAFAPDVVVCDIGLPDMDGYDLCQHLRRLPALRSARLIALTGYGQADDIARARAAGFDLHMTKPVNVSAIKLAVGTTAPVAAPASG